MAVSIYIVEDDPLLVKLLSVALAWEADFKVIGRATSAAEARSALAAITPDVVLLDLRLPDASGHTVLEEISAREQRPAVLILTVEEGVDAEVRALRAGAQGFLNKLNAAPNVARAVRRLASGSHWFSPQALDRIIAEYLPLYRAASVRAQISKPLTLREREVLDRVARGMSNAEIAAELNISFHAVKSRLDRLYKKLPTSSRSRAAALARGVGLSPPAAGKD